MSAYLERPARAIEHNFPLSNDVPVVSSMLDRSWQWHPFSPYDDKEA